MLCITYVRLCVCLCACVLENHETYENDAYENMKFTIVNKIDRNRAFYEFNNNEDIKRTF